MYIIICQLASHPSSKVCVCLLVCFTYVFPWRSVPSVYWLLSTNKAHGFYKFLRKWVSSNTCACTCAHTHAQSERERIEWESERHLPDNSGRHLFQFVPISKLYLVYLHESMQVSSHHSQPCTPEGHPHLVHTCDTRKWDSFQHQEMAAMGTRVQLYHLDVGSDLLSDVAVCLGLLSDKNRHNDVHVAHLFLNTTLITVLLNDSHLLPVFAEHHHSSSKWFPIVAFSLNTITAHLNDSQLVASFCWTPPQLI